MEYNLSQEEILHNDSNELLSIFQKNSKLEADIQRYKGYSKKFFNVLHSIENSNNANTLICHYAMLYITAISYEFKYINIKTLLDKTENKPLIDADKKNLFGILLVHKWYNDHIKHIPLHLFCILFSYLVMFCYAPWAYISIRIFSELLLVSSISGCDLKFSKKSKSSLNKLEEVFSVLCDEAMIFTASLLMAYSLVDGLTTGLTISIVIFVSLLSKMIWDNLIAIGVDMYISRKADDLHISTNIRDLVNSLDDSTKGTIINALNRSRECLKQEELTEEQWLKILETFVNVDFLHDEPLNCYDPRRLLIPLVMPIVQWKFKDLERTIRTIDTSISDVNIISIDQLVPDLKYY